MQLKENICSFLQRQMQQHASNQVQCMFVQLSLQVWYCYYNECIHLQYRICSLAETTTKTSRCIFRLRRRLRRTIQRVKILSWINLFKTVWPNREDSECAWAEKTMRLVLTRYEQIHPSIHPSMHSYAHTYIYAYVLCIYIYIHPCIHASIHAAMH